jgi:hypothetical protein
MSYNELTNGPTLRQILEAFENKSKVKITVNGNDFMETITAIQWVEDGYGIILITFGYQYAPIAQYFYDLERRVGCTDMYEIAGVG